MDVIETILLQADDPEVEEEPELKRAVNRKGTGFVTKKQVEAASTKVGFAPGAEAEKDGTASASTERIKGRKGTGYVTKERLLDVLNDLSDDEAGEAKLPAAAAVAPAPNRGKSRKGTGFVTKKKLEKLVATLGEA